MAPQRFTAIENIAPGTADWKIRVRVIRMWKQIEYNNPRQIKSIELILLDEKTKTIQATIKRSLFEQFESLIEEGSVYVIENLLVAQIDPKFKPTKHKYKLTFMRSTKCCKTETNSIPKTFFDFLPFTKIIGGVDEGFLFDVIGHVVQRDNMKETTTNVGKTNLLDIALEDLESNRVICTLWGQFAEDMNAYLDKNKEGGAVIMILQLCKLRTFGGMMGISNSFHGTKLWINADLPEVKEYKDRLGDVNVTATQTASQMSGHTSISLGDDLLQTQRMTISDIVEALSEVTDPKKKFFCTVLARIDRVDFDKGWYFESCSKCFKRVQAVGTNHYCENCDDLVVGVIRFKVHVEVIDRSGSATFVLFENTLNHLFGKSAPDMIHELRKKNVSLDCPQEFDSLLDKDFLFKMECNKGKNWNTLTVKKLSDSKDLIEKFRSLHSIKNEGDENENDPEKQLSPQVADNLKVTMDGIESTANQEDSAKKEAKVCVDEVDTPSSKSTGKRSIEDMEITSLFEDGGTQSSTTKVPKVIAVKKEPLH